MAAEAEAYEEAQRRARRVTGSAQDRAAAHCYGLNTRAEEAEEVHERERARLEWVEAEKRAEARRESYEAEECLERKEEEEATNNSEYGMPLLENWLKDQQSQIAREREFREEETEREVAYEAQMRESREREREAAKLEAREEFRQGAGTRPIEGPQGELPEGESKVPPPFMPKPTSLHRGTVPPPFMPKPSAASAAEKLRQCESVRRESSPCTSRLQEGRESPFGAQSPSSPLGGGNKGHVDPLEEFRCRQKARMAEEQRRRENEREGELDAARQKRFERQAETMRAKAAKRKEDAEQEWSRYEAEQSGREERDREYEREKERLRERLRNAQESAQEESVRFTFLHAKWSGDSSTKCRGVLPSSFERESKRWVAFTTEAEHMSRIQSLDVPWPAPSSFQDLKWTRGDRKKAFKDLAKRWHPDKAPPPFFLLLFGGLSPPSLPPSSVVCLFVL